MKKILIATLSLVAFTLSAHSQVKIGIKVGKNLSNMITNELNGSSLVSRSAYRSNHAGFIADVQLSKTLYLQPQLLYVNRGVKYIATSGSSAKVSMKNLEMPVNILYKIPVSFGKAFIGGGPALSYTLNNSLRQDGHNSTDNSWKRFDISMAATAGVEFNGGFLTSISYQRGFRDVNNTSGINAKSQSLSLSIGYLVNWNKRKV